MTEDRAISLNAVLKLIDDIREHYINYGNLLDIAREVKKLPSVEPQGGDLISRQAAIDAICKVCDVMSKKEQNINCPYYFHGCK